MRTTEALVESSSNPSDLNVKPEISIVSKINPDEAEVLLKLVSKEGEGRFMVRISQINQVGFGFKSDIQIGQLILLLDNRNIFIQFPELLHCTIEISGAINTEVESFRIVTIL